MINTEHSVWIIVIVAVITFLLRALPFFVFGEGRPTPSYLVYLGKVLPYAIIGMLVVYCLKNVSFTSAPFGIPEALACGIVVLLHVWKRNTLISVFCGVASYMILLRLF